MQHNQTLTLFPSAPDHAPSSVASASPAGRGLQWLALALVVAAACAVTAYFAQIKLAFLNSWKFTSDLYTYDQMLQEMLKGHWGLEYTYGNQFGDHALFLIPLLAPFKLLLGRHMIVLLTVLGPIVYGAMGVALFIAARATSGLRIAILCAAAYFFGILPIRGLIDGIYGGHVDTITGYIATAAAAALTWRWDARETGRGQRASDILFWSLWGLFLASKEEMALLGVGFFMVILLFSRNRFHWIAFAVSCFAFAAGWVMMKLCVTPWNRTNENLLRTLLQEIHAHGVRSVFFSPEQQVAWLVICVLTILFLVTHLITMRRSIFALALYAMALAKFGLNFLSFHTQLDSWHSFPVLTMMLGALIVQLQYMGRWRTQRGVTYALAAGLCLVTAVVFWRMEGSFIRHLPEMTRKLMAPAQIAQRQACLDALKQKMDKNKVVSIPLFSVRDWVDGYRYAFFARGVAESPRGIADYLVFDRVFTGQDAAENKQFTAYMDGVGKLEFAPVAQNEFFTLYERRAIAPDASRDRERFVQIFGAAAIGQNAAPPLLSAPLPASAPAPAH